MLMLPWRDELSFVGGRRSNFTFLDGLFLGLASSGVVSWVIDCSIIVSIFYLLFEFLFSIITWCNIFVKSW